MPYQTHDGTRYYIDNDGYGYGSSLSQHEYNQLREERAAERVRRRENLNRIRLLRYQKADADYGPLFLMTPVRFRKVLYCGRILASLKRYNEKDFPEKVDIYYCFDPEYHYQQKIGLIANNTYQVNLDNGDDGYEYEDNQHWVNAYRWSNITNLLRPDDEWLFLDDTIDQQENLDDFLINNYNECLNLIRSTITTRS